MKLRVVSAIALLVVLGGWALASLDRCGTWDERPPSRTQLTRAAGELRVGAGRVVFELPYPMGVGGYGPLLSTATSASSALAARAVVLEAGGRRLAVVLMDLLLVSPQLRDGIVKDQPAETWVVATHTHSGPSGFDARLASEVAALGPQRADATAALITAARLALQQAHSAVTPVQLEWGEVEVQGVSVARSGTDVDRRVSVLRFIGAQGPVAQWVIASAHPTLVPRRSTTLHADWPGLLADRLERAGGPLTLVMQGAGGNASVDRRQLATPEAVAERLESVTQSMVMAGAAPSLELAWTSVSVWLPRPEATRLAPPFTRGAVENVLCDGAEHVAQVHGLQLGPVRWLLLPFEASAPAGTALEQRAAASRVVSLANGYGGYVELAGSVERNEGEARRQYYPPELLSRLEAGASEVRAALDGPSTSPLSPSLPAPVP